MANTNAQPDLYALIVGISIYQSPNVSNLSCVNDAVNLENFLNDPLTKAAFGEMHIQTLHDNQATKANVVKGFREHLSKAKEGDTVLFFFGGHGVREETTVDAFRKAQSDGKIAGIVCVDCEPTTQHVPEATTLSDKEMRYLIRKLAADESGNPKAHVVTIFDCCHSGGNTRSVTAAQLPPNARQLQRGALAARTWEGFIFHDDAEVNTKIKAGAKLPEILPNGNHVMLAACREVELAWEDKGKGNFTTALVEVLKQNNGKISYHELHSRVKNRMRSQYIRAKDGVNDMRQTPQFYLNSPAKSNRYNLFLTNQANDAPTYGVIEETPHEGWRIDIGALHGVEVDKEGIAVEIYEGDAKTPLPQTASVRHVFPSNSTLKMPAGFVKKPGVSYRGMIKGLGIPPLKIFLSGDNAGVEAAKKHFAEEMENVRSKAFELVGEEEAADYAVIANGGEYNLYLPFDHKRPRVKAISYSGPQAKDAQGELYAYLVQIAQWTFLKNLERTDVFKLNGFAAPDYPIEVKMYKYDSESEQEHPLPANGNVFTIELPQEDPWLPIRLEITNHYPKDLYVGLAYMEHNFSVEADAEDDGISYFRERFSNPSILSGTSNEDGEVHIHSSGEEASNGKVYAEVGSGGYIESDNWLGYSDFFKLIVSEVDFDIKSFHMEGLPRPYDEDAQSRAGFSRDRKKKKEKKPPKWEIQTFELFVANPSFQPEEQAV